MSTSDPQPAELPDQATGEAEGKESIFWGPILTLSKAERVINWVGGTILWFAGVDGFLLARDFIGGQDRPYIFHLVLIAGLVGPAAWMMSKKSRIAAGLLIAVVALFTLAIGVTMAEAIVSQTADMGRMIFLLVAVAVVWLTIRAFRATMAWQRLPKPRKTASMFD